MSISLPNGTILATPSQPQISAAVTRILHLNNFPAELKTRDIQVIFKEWENEKGGFRIKWLDDVNALVVFNDATVAKRAYLSLLLNTPATFPPPAQIRPYDRPDAAAIIAQLSARAMGHRASASSALTASMSYNIANSNSNNNNNSSNGISGLPENHGRAASMSSGLSGFVMPTTVHGGANHGVNKNPLQSGPSTSSAQGAVQRGRGPLHNRSGSASSSWSRSGFGAGAGVLNFPSSGSGRLPTHSESSPSLHPSRSSSSEEDTIVIMDGAGAGAQAGSGGRAFGGSGLRRDSLSAEKALREVEKALAHVEAR